MRTIEMTIILFLAMSYFALLFLKYYVPIWYKRLPWLSYMFFFTLWWLSLFLLPFAYTVKNV